MLISSIYNSQDKLLSDAEYKKTRYKVKKFNHKNEFLKEIYKFIYKIMKEAKKVPLREAKRRLWESKYPSWVKIQCWKLVLKRYKLISRVYADGERREKQWVQFMLVLPRKEWSEVSHKIKYEKYSVYEKDLHEWMVKHITWDDRTVFVHLRREYDKQSKKRDR